MNRRALRCLNCNNLEYWEEYDSMGACEDYVFCPNCHFEVHQETGVVHYMHHDDTKVQMCCYNTLKRFEPKAIKAADKQRSLFS